MSLASLPQTAPARPENPDAAVPEQAPQYLTFALGRESYGVAIQAVREILEVPSFTVVPMVPGFVRGVINLRGAVVPVIDLAARLELGSAQASRRSCVVIVELPVVEAGEANGGADGARHVIGALVDAVHEVVEIAAARIEAAPGVGTRVPPEYLSGVARIGGRLVGILNLARALSTQELARLVCGHRAA
jgi:purine-binding chemotaxis protein CheW